MASGRSWTDEKARLLPARRNTPASVASRRWFGLSARLLVLTVLFVMLAEVLIYMPSVANFRRNWLNDRLAAGQIVSMVLETMPHERMPPGFKWRLLDEAGIFAVAAEIGNGRRLISATSLPADLRRIDLCYASWTDQMRETVVDLLWADPRPLLVTGFTMVSDEVVEIVVQPKPLRHAMLRFSRELLLVSLIISGITAALVFLALHILIVRPTRRLAANVAAFEADPSDEGRIVRPTPRSDEIGLLEQAVARMQTTLADDLRQQKRLAALGLAVSKINHDLRNLLAAAQLISDRLSELTDPAVQRFAPKLIATLDRANSFCTASLVYGRTAEAPAQRRLVRLAPIIEDAAELAGVIYTPNLAFTLRCPRDLHIDADPEQLSRVFLNLFRNALQALPPPVAPDGGPAITVEAYRTGSTVTIRLADNGPGVPDRIRPRVFEAFVRGSAQGTGGSGLGLAITAELVQLNGGTIVLEDSEVGASFRIEITDRDAAFESRKTE